jgi:hypothetical protein
MALIVIVFEATAEPLTVEATLNEKLDVGSMTVRPIFTTSPAAILQVLLSVITRAPEATDAPPEAVDSRQLAALVSTSDTVSTLVVATTALASLSVTVIVSPLGMALGAVSVIT